MEDKNLTLVLLFRKLSKIFITVTFSSLKMSPTLRRFQIFLVFSDKDSRFLPIGPSTVEGQLVVPNKSMGSEIPLPDSIPSSPLPSSVTLGRSLILLEPQYLHLGLVTINACLTIRI